MNNSTSNPLASHSPIATILFVALVGLLLVPALSFAQQGRLPESQAKRMEQGRPFFIRIGEQKVPLKRKKLASSIQVTTLGVSKHTESFSTAHIKAFESEGSAPLTVVIDNGRVLKGFRRGTDSQFTNFDIGKRRKGRFTFQALESNGETCAAHAPAIEGGSSGEESGGTAEASGATSEAELALVLDTHFVADHGGSVQAAIDEATSVAVAADIIYSRDVATQLKLVDLVVVTDPAQNPTSNTDARQALDDFGPWKVSNVSTPHDLAHLFTGLSLNSSTIGIAWLCTVCNSSNNTGVNERFTSNFTQLTILLSHEMGHNFCANHDNNPGIMTPSIGTNDFFSSLSITEITDFVATRACVDEIDNSVCGDGIVEGPEECDGTNLGGAGCTDVMCSSGTPTCVDCRLEYGTCSDCPVCDNDGTCEVDENCQGCPNDCVSGSGGICGNGVCETADGEDCVSCSADCNGKQNGKPSSRFCCGDGDGQNAVGCSDSRCSGSGNTCSTSPSPSYCCGDTACEGAEDGYNCELDCGAPPFCGDGICNNGESVCDCSADCGLPPAENCGDGQDNDCDGAVDCNDSDCSAVPACQGPQCFPTGSSCVSNSECCSNKCRGPSGRKSCK